MPPNPPNNAHGFAMRSMSLRDMQSSKSEQKIFLAPPPLPNPGDAPVDYVFIDQQSDSLGTSDYQFGFKSHSSIMMYSTMLIETIQYYDENGRQPLYVLFLDARKAFDHVCYNELFNILPDKKVCPRIVQLLCYMYLNQACCVK